MSNEKSTNQSHAIFAIFSVIISIEYFYLIRSFLNEEWVIREIFEVENIQTVFDRLTFYPIVLYLVYIFLNKILEFKDVSNKILTAGSYFAGALFLILSYYFIPMITLVVMPIGYIFTMYTYFSSKKVVADVEEEEKEGFILDDEPIDKPGYLNLKVLLTNGEMKWLNINSVQGTMTIGGNGSGKSWSIIEPILFQQVYKGWGIFNYDYKYPDLTQQINRYIEFCQSIGRKTYDHWIVNWTDPSTSHRFNIFDSRVVKDKLDVINVCTSFIVNIKKEWAKNTDFWADAAIAYFSAVSLWWKLHEPEKCDLPHVVQTCLIPHHRVLPVLLADEECADIMVPFLEAKELKAGQQLAGMTGSLQIFLGKLTIPIFYWILSGNDFTVDVNNPRDPKIVSIGNAGLYEDPLKPIIGTISKLAIMAMNRDYTVIQREEGVPENEILPQIYSAFNFDELSTAYLDGLERLPNQARSKKVASHVLLQNTPQLTDVYGKEKSNVLISSFGNLLVLNMKDAECGEKLSKQFGKVNVKIKSIGETEQKGFDSSGGSNNTGYTLQQRNAVEVDDFTSQATGHFYAMYTIPPTKKGEKPKKPFASGNIYTLEYPEVLKKITKKIKEDPYAPCYLKLKDHSPIQPFVKFSNYDDNIVKEKEAMNEVIEENYHRIRKEVKDIFAKALTGIHEAEEREEALRDAEEQTSVIFEDDAENFAVDPLSTEADTDSNDFTDSENDSSGETESVSDESFSSDEDDDSEYF